MTLGVRVLGWAAAVGLVVALVVLDWSDTARAHDGVYVTVHSDGIGSIWATAVWRDGHLLTEPLVASMFATSDTSARIGPVAMTGRSGQSGAAAYDGTLSAGRWLVVVDVASPGLGHCEASISVSGTSPGGAAGSPGSATPMEITCANPAPGSDAPVDSTTSIGPAASRGAWLAGGLAALIVLLAAFGYFVHRSLR